MADDVITDLSDDDITTTFRSPVATMEGDDDATDTGTGPEGDDDASDTGGDADATDADNDADADADADATDS